VSTKIQPAVVGAAGYAGFELTRLLLRHPRVKSPLLLAREDGASGALTDIYPQISGNGNSNAPLTLEPFSWELLRPRGVDVLFLATPHETSRQWVPEAIRRGIRVVDLSGAWRLREPQHRAIYNFHDADSAAAEAAAAQAIYGLPELHRSRISKAAVVANPGCYATSCILALAPLVSADLLDLAPGIICDSKSGVSGAGKQPTPRTHFVEVAGNFSAYSVFKHRHAGEIVEQLGLADADLVFTPHLLPIPRGILSTIYARLRQPAEAATIESAFCSFYKGSHFVRVFTPPRLPEVQHSAYSNFCDIGFVLGPDKQKLIIVSCLDNLLKGAAGQAVQNMNLMFGWAESEGLG
jgi:N-acetyl-gamma-glutamyl-phosphate reductase